MNFIYVGIDVSKDTCVSAIDDNGQITMCEIANDERGIRKFIRKLPVNCWCALEATGVYSVRLALRLHQAGIKTSVINPLQIKRFAQTKLNRTKTDAVDAVLIAEYVKKMQPELYRPAPSFITLLQQKRAFVKQLLKTKNAFNNQVLGFKKLPNPDKEVTRQCNSIIKKLELQITNTEQQMEQLASQHCKQLFDQIISIPGLSHKAAIEFIILTAKFSNFSSARQFSAHIGVCPNINQSGTSIRGDKGISRVGSAYTRSVLYMCSLTAFRYNPQCKNIYDRLVSNGKPKKVALVAVINKLIRQVFGLINSGTYYDMNLEIS